MDRGAHFWAVSEIGKDLTEVQSGQKAPKTLRITKNTPRLLSRKEEKMSEHQYFQN